MSMIVSRIDAEDLVWTLHHDYMQVLKSAGHERPTEMRPRVTIWHILACIKPFHQQTHKDKIQWKEETFDKNDLRCLIRELSSQAKKWPDEKMVSSEMNEATMNLRTRN